jgi:crotonobetainyl-CoA:carnitine CoA-transferase CaiB-like acyl-CoA transferase
VIDLTRGPLARVAQMLADLGADVVRVEPRGGGSDRRAYPLVGDVSLAFVAANLGKSTMRLDILDPADRQALEALVGSADIVIEDTDPGSAEAAALDVAGIAARLPQLVIISISNFGQSTLYARWRATTPVLLSLSGVIARSGIEGRPPLLPPGDLGMECAVPQAAFVTLLAFYNSLLSGRGDRLDFSLLDAASQALDPGFGMTGSASGGATPSASPRGRPAVGRAYPIVPCGDGHVRLCILAPRQWQGMLEWMGRPEEFTDPSFNSLAVRFQSQALLAAIARFFEGKTRAELETAGQRFGVPIAAVLSIEEAVASDHIADRHAYADVPLSSKVSASLPNGVLEIDGRRAAAERSVPVEHKVSPRPPRKIGWLSGGAPPARPLAGLRVLDLGVIVVGGEQGRLLGDQGAEVIKIESAAFPDGSRQIASATGPISANFAAGNRNKKSLGLNLRDPRGRGLFLQLAQKADIILSNFKPGTLESLELGAEVLAQANPRLIIVDSSAFGSHGPWSRRLGYGPLVRAASGLTALWHYPDDPESFSDSVTIYPDHVSARVGLIGILALLIRRLRTGVGGRASVSQSEVMLSHLAPRIAAMALERRGLAIESGPEHDAPWGIFQCAGDDEWCAVTVRGDADWKALALAIGRLDLAEDERLSTKQGRTAARADIDRALARWTAGRGPNEAMSLLQTAGVPAGAMRRVTELPKDAYYQERRFFRLATHPYLADDFLVEGPLVQAENLPDPPLEPAPLLGQQTREVARDLLELSDSEIDRLIAEKVLEAPEYAPPS